jgi:hypothetical protein
MMRAQNPQHQKGYKHERSQPRRSLHIRTIRFDIPARQRHAADKHRQDQQHD